MVNLTSLGCLGKLFQLVFNLTSRLLTSPAYQTPKSLIRPSFCAATVICLPRNIHGYSPVSCGHHIYISYLTGDNSAHQSQQKYFLLYLTVENHWLAVELKTNETLLSFYWFGQWAVPENFVTLCCLPRYSLWNSSTCPQPSNHSVPSPQATTHTQWSSFSGVDQGWG